MRPMGAVSKTLATLLVLAAAGLPVQAAETDAAGPDTPAPAKPTVIAVLGDSLGDGLWAGFYRLLRRNKAYEVVKKSQVSTGLTQINDFDWLETARDIAKTPGIDIAVVFVGANDQQALKYEKKWRRFKSAKWTEVYRGRIVELIKILKKKKIKVFWVGLPVMQKPNFDAGSQFLNGLYKQAAEDQGILYIDIRKVTAGEDGDYATHYKNLQGKMRLMRAEDGVHFTMSGYIAIADHVLKRIQAHGKNPRRKKIKTVVSAPAAGGGAAVRSGRVTDDPAAHR